MPKVLYLWLLKLALGYFCLEFMHSENIEDNFQVF
jgi:hypothetical protein